MTICAGGGELHLNACAAAEQWQCQEMGIGINSASASKKIKMEMVVMASSLSCSVRLGRSEPCMVPSTCRVQWQAKKAECGEPRWIATGWRVWRGRVAVRRVWA